MYLCQGGGKNAMFEIADWGQQFSNFKVQQWKHDILFKYRHFYTISSSPPPEILMKVTN